MLGGTTLCQVTVVQTVSTRSIGSRAEQAAADYLIGLGFELLQMNYRKPHCEIDIVARLDTAIYFVEVKYRGSDDWGSGLEYITPTKVRRMERSAATWVRDHAYGGPCQLAAVEVSGSDYEVTAFVDDIM